MQFFSVLTFHFCYFNFLIASLCSASPLYFDVVSHPFPCPILSLHLSFSSFFCKATPITTSFFLRKCSNLLYLSYEVLATLTLLPQKLSASSVASLIHNAGFMEIRCSDLTTNIYLKSGWIQAAFWFFTHYSCLLFVTCSTVYLSKVMQQNDTIQNAQTSITLAQTVS